MMGGFAPSEMLPTQRPQPACQLSKKMKHDENRDGFPVADFITGNITSIQIVCFFPCFSSLGMDPATGIIAPDGALSYALGFRIDGPSLIRTVQVGLLDLDIYGPSLPELVRRG